jgi:hypothetical protein
MLRRDGSYTIFKIQHWIEPCHMYKEGKWAESNIGLFLKNSGYFTDYDSYYSEPLERMAYTTQTLQ